MPIPEFVLQSILDQILTFLANRGQNIANDILTRKQIKSAIQSAVDRFESEYPDKGLSSALVNNAGFFSLPSVQTGIQDYLAHPLAEFPVLKINESLASLLPKRMREVDAIKAAQSFLVYLRQELGSVTKLQGVIGLAVQEKMLKELELIGEGVKPKAINLDESKQKYLKYIIDANQYIDPRGIMQTRRSISLKLDEVYISLTAEVGVSSHSVDRPIDLRAELDDDWAPDEISVVQNIVSTEKNVETIDLARATREYLNLVFLGDPGSGKTTLMRFLTLQYALSIKNNQSQVVDQDNNNYGFSRFPFFIRIASYANAFSHDKLVSLREFIIKSSNEINISSDALSIILEEELSSGRAIVLLDGLDEVVNERDRLEISRSIERFMASCHPQTQFIVTSRIAGYRSVPLSGMFFHFVLRELERQQIEKFLRKWCPASERSQKPDAPDKEIDRRALAEIDGILQAVDETPGVRRLASNPLMLTILALIHQNGMRLPSRRVELYELAVKTLLEDWELARGLSKENIVSENEALRVLGPLAYWLHDTKPDGMASEREIKEKLGNSLADARGLELDSLEVQNAVTDFLRRVREHTGVFVERAPKQYGFMHLTFEEYFAARELVRRRTEVITRIYENRHKSRWEEPILLGLAFLSEGSPEDVVDIIRTSILGEGNEAISRGFRESKFNNELHRDIIFSLRVIGDCMGLNANFRKQIVSRLLEICFDVDGYGKYTPLFEYILKAFQALSGTEIAQDAANITVDKFVKVDDSEVRKRSIILLGLLGIQSDEIVYSLIRALNNDIDLNKSWAATSLCRLGVKTQPVLNMLIKEINSKGSVVRGQIAIALGQMRVPSAEVVSALLDTLKSDNLNLRAYAATALGLLGDSSIEIIDALLECLISVSTNKKFVRGRAASALLRLEPNMEIIVDKLLDVIRGQDINLRVRSISALRLLGYTTPELVETLLVALNDSDLSVRVSAALTLRKLDSNSAEDVVKGLLVSLKDDKSLLSSHAMTTLVNLIPKLSEVNTSIVDELYEAVKDSRYYVRTNAAIILSWIGICTSEVETTLIKGLDTNDNDARFYVASSIVHLANSNSEISNTLIKTLRDATGLNVRFSVAWSLAQLKIASPEVVDTLFSVFENRKTEKDIRKRAVIALTLISSKDLSIIERLIQLLKNNSFDSRSFVAYSFGSMSNITPEMLDALLLALNEKKDNRTLWQAATTIAQLNVRLLDQTFEIGKIQEKIHRALIMSKESNVSDVLWGALWNISTPT